MNLWRRLFGRRSGPSVPSEPPLETTALPAGAAPPDVAPADVGDDPVSALARLGREGGPGAVEALAALRSATDTVRESEALGAITLALETAPAGGAFEQLRIATASLLSERGERARALAVAARCRSPHGMLIVADLHATRGELGHALCAVERVLARDFDLPGARERHARWSQQLGRGRSSSVATDTPTAIRPHAPTLAYRLLREVGRGGAGTVYEAEDEALGRRAALKIFHRAKEDEEAITRESRLTARFAGPGIVRLYDADPAAGWLATEWLEHGSLRDLVRAGRAHELADLAWLPRVLRGLARLHANRWVHGDLKPSNILFRSLDDPVLADFGTSTPLGSVPPGGTAAYLSPERVVGGAADPRDDVYAIGRIVEDLLAATADSPSREEHAALADLCLSGARPVDAAALLDRLGPTLQRGRGVQ